MGRVLLWFSIDDAAVDFGPMDRHIGRPPEPELHSVAADLQHHDLNIRPNHDGLALLPAEYEHDNPP